MAESGNRIVLGGRGSQLALAQLDEAARLIKDRFPEVTIESRVVSTAGDKDQSLNISSIGAGIFVKKIEQALMRGEIDIAVHSLKDLPSKLPYGLALAGVPYREDPRDAVVSRNGIGIDDLPAGAIVATGSARRRALLHSMRNDIILRPLRGNVTTRLRMIDDDDGEIDALILAAAGLKRLGMKDRIAQHLSCMSFVAAPGQGALGLETRGNDTYAREICQAVEHKPTRQCVDAEREFVSAIASGCTVPMGAHARIDGDIMSMSVFVSDPSGSQMLIDSDHAPREQGGILGRRLGEKMLTDGALELISSP